MSNNKVCQAKQTEPPTMTNLKAITRTAIEICEHLEGLQGQIRRDSNGLEMIETFAVGDGLLTLVWSPIIKKVRREASLRKAIAKGIANGLDLSLCEGGWEIRNDRTGARVAFSTSRNGIAQLMTRHINKMLIAQARRTLELSDPLFIPKICAQ
jgi:hypothetical protein